MQSLKQQITILVVVVTLVLAVCFMTAVGLQIKKSSELAAITKAKSDMATAKTIIDLKYPGPWRVVDGYLYKGDVKINNNFEIVDYISSLTGDTCTLFLGSTRVSTTIKKSDGQRAVGTHSSDVVAKSVLANGKEYLGEAEVVGEKYQTAYSPLYDERGNIIGMFYVGISKKFYDELLYESLLRMAFIGVALTLLVFVGSLYFTQRFIIKPLKLITAETQKVTSGSISAPVEIGSKNEIGELAQSFNQLVEWIQALTYQISKTTGATLPQANSFSNADLKNETVLPNNQSKEDREDWGELPKGLNEVTLQQILSYLKNRQGNLSVSEIAEEVKLTKVTVRRYLDFMEKCGRVKVEMQYGPIGRPLKLYTFLK
ncbi:cache domain-containing protein [Desulforamulus putei]|uniref:Methyl-accepting chemotaxis protein n=1 Tax=Desulforamulus putei DSM 12395 TaxID=1121429 RepID=A0A1M4XH33_9FIRM|nr:cache domain-containing protein [Desulforamulus putei]SHE92666.1 methyl-accepting chemotaxis protein [Desulforamulus putei DSM 12395]